MLQYALIVFILGFCFYLGDTSIVNIKSILDLPPKSSVDFLYVCTRL